VLPVDPAAKPRSETFPEKAPRRDWKIASPALVAASAVLVIAVLVANLQSPRVFVALLISLMSALLVFALLLADVIRHMRSTERQAKTVFAENLWEVHQMADNIQEVFWVIDAESKRATYINPAYEIITGRSCQSLIKDPLSYEEAIHPEDRAHVQAKLARAAQNGHFEERFRIVRPDGEIRWVWVRGRTGRTLSGLSPQPVRSGETNYPATHVPASIPLVRIACPRSCVFSSRPECSPSQALSANRELDGSLVPRNKVHKGGRGTEPKMPVGYCSYQRCSP